MIYLSKKEELQALQPLTQSVQEWLFSADDMLLSKPAALRCDQATRNAQSSWERFRLAHTHRHNPGA